MNVLNSLYKKLLRYAKKRNLWIGFGLVLLFNIVFLPLFPKLYKADIPIDKVLDLKFSYASDEVYSFFEELGERGRKAYLLSESLVDTAYMLVYGLFYSTLLVFIIERKKLYARKYVIILPFVVAFFDLLENLGIISLLLFYPSRKEILVVLTSSFSSAKWIMVLMTFIALFGLLFSRKNVEAGKNRGGT